MSGLGLASALVAGGTQGYFAGREQERQSAANKAKAKGIAAAEQWKVDEGRESERIKQERVQLGRMEEIEAKGKLDVASEERRYKSAEEVERIKAGAKKAAKPSQSISAHEKFNKYRDKWQLEADTLNAEAKEEAKGSYFDSASRLVEGLFPGGKTGAIADVREVTWQELAKADNSKLFEAYQSSVIGGEDVSTPSEITKQRGVVPEGLSHKDAIAAALGQKQDVTEPLPISMKGDEVVRGEGFFEPSQQEVEKKQEEELAKQYATTGTESKVSKVAALNARVQERNLLALGKKIADWSVGGDADKKKRPSVTKDEAEAMVSSFGLSPGDVKLLTKSENKDLAYRIYRSTSKKQAQELAKQLKK